MAQHAHHARLGLVLAGVLALLPPAGAHAQAPAGAPAPEAPGQAIPAPAGRAGDDYRVGVGDTLGLWVWRNPDLTVDLLVRPDGKIGVPLLEDSIQAQGRTPDEIRTDISQRVAALVQNPVVVVLVKAVSTANNDAAIHVIGAAATPKTVSYRAGLTALDVIVESGGLNIYADGDRAKLIRRENGGYVSRPLRLKRLIRAGDMSANVLLMPGDVIRIPERWF